MYLQVEARKFILDKWHKNCNAPIVISSKKKSKGEQSSNCGAKVADWKESQSRLLRSGYQKKDCCSQVGNPKSQKEI